MITVISQPPKYPNHKEVQDLAYRYWEKDGKPEDRSMDFWLRAQFDSIDKYRRQLAEYRKKYPHYGMY